MRAAFLRSGASDFAIPVGRSGACFSGQTAYESPVPGLATFARGGGSVLHARRAWRGERIALDQAETSRRSGGEECDDEGDRERH